MKHNLNFIDRSVRTIFGVILISLVFVGPINAWFLLGLIPLITGLIGYCPVYHILDISTNKMNPEFKVHTEFR